jgi:pimeloyl-ACP methyl ester carboxylesterase
VKGLLKHVGLFVAYGALCVLVTLIAVYLYFLRSQPELRPWHTERLDAEFRAADAATVKTLDDYRRLETRLFEQLRERVYAKIDESDRSAINRYSSGSLSDPMPHTPDWNRTFELSVDKPRGGAVLLHGLTDAPYTMRAIAVQLHAKGYWVVGLRLPGHGTAPSGILYARWEDWAAATRLATRHVRERIGPDRPLHLVGYSSGAGLAVEYAAARLQGEDIPKVDSLILISPAIGLSRAAALAGVQAGLADVKGVEKAAWTAIVPEYDPFKYNSFTARAGEQIFLVMRRVEAQLTALGGGTPVKGMPRILAFQSAADATVSTPAVVNALFRRLAPEGHELVFFDINRRADSRPLFNPGVLAVRSDLFDGPPLPFDLTAIVNEDETSRVVVALRSGLSPMPVRRAPETALANSFTWSSS